MRQVCKRRVIDAAGVFVGVERTKGNDRAVLIEFHKFGPNFFDVRAYVSVSMADD